jgi:hypothetical protein
MFRELVGKGSLLALGRLEALERSPRKPRPETPGGKPQKENPGKIT